MKYVWRVVELPWRVFGRPVRPFHLALTLATFVTAFQLYELHGDGLSSIILAHAAFLAGVAMLAGWVAWPWRRTSASLSAWGALFALGVWAARGAFVVLTDTGGIARSPILSGVLSVAWCFVAFGIWLMERAEQDALREAEGARE